MTVIFKSNFFKTALNSKIIISHKKWPKYHKILLKLPQKLHQNLFISSPSLSVINPRAAPLFLMCEPINCSSNANCLQWASIISLPLIVILHIPSHTHEISPRIFILVSSFPIMPCGHKNKLRMTLLSIVFIIRDPFVVLVYIKAWWVYQFVEVGGSFRNFG